MSEIVYFEDLLSKIVSLPLFESDKGALFRNAAFKENIKILYTYLQKNKYDLCYSSLISLEDAPLNTLKLSTNLFDVLLYGIETRQISPEILLVSASSLISLLEIISPLPELCFSYLLKSDLQNCNVDSVLSLMEAFSFISKFSEKQNLLSSVKDIPSYSIYEGEVHLRIVNCSSFETFYNFSETKPTFNSYILLHGILNTKPLWLFSKLTLNDNEDNTKSITCLESHYNILLFIVWPLISQLCLTSCSYSYQSLQVLYLWIKISSNYLIELKPLKHLGNVVESSMVKKFVDDGCPEIKEHDLSKINTSENHLEPCILCHKSSLAKWFSLELSSRGAVFALLNLNWENRSKGASSIIQQCFVELLSLHEFFLQGHSISSIRKIVRSVINSRMWYTKGTYLQLQLALKYICTIEVLEDYPEIPSYMSKCLKSNDLLPAVTNLYQCMILQLKIEDWLKFFAIEHAMIASCDDKSLQHNYLTMWLTSTITHYPDLLSQLLSLCGNSLSGWKTKLYILKIAKSKNLISLDCKMTQDSKNHFSNFGSPDNLESQNEISEIICKSLTCGDEMIRADAFNFLCNSKKTSEEFNKVEIKLIMLFFEENLNIDSTNFCESIIKSFIILIHRLRDAANAEIKKLLSHQSMSTKERNLSTLLDVDCKAKSPVFGNVEIISKIGDAMNSNNSDVLNKDKSCSINNKASPQLKLLIDCLSFFIYSLNENLNICGNCNRIYTSLKLYLELLSAFFSIELGVIIHKFNCVVQFINLFTKNGFVNNVIPSTSYFTQISNLMIPSTLDSLIALMTHEMNAVKELSAKILTFAIKMNPDIPATTSNLCLKEALKMIDSPKFSIAESGAILFKIFVKSDQTFGTILSGTTDLNKRVGIHELDVVSMVNYLIEKVKHDFEKSQENILYCSSNTPIYGSIMTLTMILSEVVTSVAVELDGAFVTNKIVILTSLFNNIVEKILEYLASKSAVGSKISPSFAEMGDAINAMIKECKEKEINATPGGSLFSCPLRTENEWNINEEIISDDHQMVLSFCWQLLKVCCWSCGKLTSSWNSIISLQTQELMISSIVIRVLTGTRHKGAMEAANSALQEISLTIYKAQLCAKEKILEGQLYKILKSLKNLSETSVTRRSAGLSMIFTAICQAIPSRRVSNVTVDIINQLLSISQIQVNDEVAHNDVSPALCLHILHSMISNASLTSTTLPLLADICITCLKFLNSKSWAIRNASLQLYGAVVSRIIGQKKVKDDCSSLNCITVSAFFSRYTLLCSVIIDKLDQCIRNDDKTLLSELQLSNVKLENTVCRRSDVNEMKYLKASSSLQPEYTTFEKLDSSLVPLLSILSRLNPGTETQQNVHVKEVISALLEKVSYFLSYPVSTVRRLAASSLCSLTLANDTDDLINKISHKGLNSICVNANLTHGCLITLKLLLQNHEDNLLKNSNLRRLLIIIISDCYPVFVNKSLALDLANALSLEMDLNVSLPTNWRSPGYSELSKKIVSRNLKTISNLNADTIFKHLMSRDHEISEEVLNYIELNIDIINKEILFNLQGKCWKCICNNNTKFELQQMIRSLTLILSKVRLDINNCIPSFSLLNRIIINRNGTILHRNCLILISYFVKYYDRIEVGSRLPVSNMLDGWTKTIEIYANSKSTEDNRSSAVEALEKAILFIYNNNFINRISIVKALLELVQDENSSIRIKAAQIICCFTKTFQGKIIGNAPSCKNYQLDLECRQPISISVSNQADDVKIHFDFTALRLESETDQHKSEKDSRKDTELDTEKMDNSKHSGESVNFCDLFMKAEYGIKCLGDITIQPNVAIKLFVKFIITEALTYEDKGLIELLGNNFKCDYSIYNTNSNTTKLFSSYSDNMYKEKHVISLLIISLLELEIKLPKYTYSEDFKSFCKNYAEFGAKNLIKHHNSGNDFVDLFRNRGKLEESKITNLYQKFLKLLNKVANSY